MPFLISPDLLDFPENFSYDSVELGLSVLVPEQQQMYVYQSIDLSQGDAQILGTLVLLDK